jgi:alpha-D-ribose 1-methylphosphonate 5-triphosphate diphosphatase
MTSISLINGRVLGPDGVFEKRDVHVGGGLIEERPARSGERLDCGGLFILPGLVDVHGDQFEREVHPRPGVDIPFPVALLSVDRLLLANGITTAFHGLTLSWEPGQRSLDAGRQFMAALDRARPGMIAEHRVQLRWETFAFDAVEDIEAWLGEAPRPALAFNDHTTSTLEKVAAGRHQKLEQWASRGGVTPGRYLELVEEAARNKADVPAMVERLAAVARRSAAVMLAHDLADSAEQARFRSLGATVAEFPLTEAVAKDAAGRGEEIVLGAPNVVRGGSHTGALTAEDAVAAGTCTVLASDYHYPSMIAAVGKLAARGVATRAEARALVSANAARSMQLDDRGEISAGRRADLVIAEWPEGGEPLVRAVVAGGTITRFGW